MQMNWGSEISGYSLNKRDFAVLSTLSTLLNLCTIPPDSGRNTVANLHRCPHIYLTAKRRLVPEQKYAEVRGTRLLSTTFKMNFEMHEYPMFYRIDQEKIFLMISLRK